MAELSGRVALVSGGASGIGAASVRELSKRGAYVWIADIDEAGAQALAQDLQGVGAQAGAIMCDIGDEDQIRDAVEHVVAISGRLDIMHNNAALLDPETLSADEDILSIPTAVWDKVMSVTLRGTMLGCRYAVKAMMRSGGGSIINTSSMLGIAPDYRAPAYCTAKAGINMLTEWVAARYGRDGIRCNAVAPSIIRTPMLDRYMPKELMDLHADCTLTPFLGVPEDIAAIVAFLAGDSSRYITGQIIRADGGSTVPVPMYAGTRAVAGNKP